MAEIALMFCAFDSFMGRLIRYGTEGEVGHVDAILPNGDLLGAQAAAGLGGKPSGVQIRPEGYQEDCGGRNFVRVTIKVTPKQKDAFLTFLHSQVGKPYDVKSIIGFILGRQWRDPDAWFCSELIAAALEHAGVFAHPLRTRNDRVTPQELLMICSVLGVAEQMN